MGIVAVGDVAANEAVQPAFMPAHDGGKCRLIALTRRNSERCVGLVVRLIALTRRNSERCVGLVVRHGLVAAVVVNTSRTLRS